jgi:hypothetical protein
MDINAQARSQCVAGSMSTRALQSAKITEFGEALIAAGYVRLDEQARVLGLSRSTTWTIIRAKHKNSGLSALLIRRMLSQPRLPVVARTKLLEYIEEKSLGMYGHNPSQIRRFLEALIPIGHVTRSLNLSRGSFPSTAERNTSP